MNPQKFIITRPIDNERGIDSITTYEERMPIGNNVMDTKRMAIIKSTPNLLSRLLTFSD